MSSKERNNLFKSKRAAMIVQGSWFIGDLKEIENSVDIIPFPWIEQKESHPGALVYGLGGGCFYVSQKAWEDEERKLASIKLLRALTSKEAAKGLAAKTGMLSNVKIDESKVGYSRLVKKGQEMIWNAKELIGPPDTFVDRAEWERTIVKEFPYVLAGREQAEVLWEKVMKKSLENK
jgi:raffinose/stachyose/melibiose transport system substrate-binding protein